MSGGRRGLAARATDFVEAPHDFVEAPHDRVAGAARLRVGLELFRDHGHVIVVRWVALRHDGDLRSRV